MAEWIKMPLGMELGLGPGHIVLDGDLVPPPLKGDSPNFWTISVVAKWLDRSRCHGREVGLSPSDIVLDGDPASPHAKEGRAPPFFANVCCGQMAGWMKIALGTAVDLSPGQIVLDGDPATPLPVKGAQQPPPSLRPMSIVATVSYLSYC